ncbi:MAG: hypothetical protein DI537_10380 [Stutzerimonas stutzeri]|nr:MAG: hypothetical protein DI537_10380 [Stutzerimonas stutzeri]
MPETVDATQQPLRVQVAILPVDDDARDHANSALPFEMISAGADALDACREDLESYVPGETPDWDSGMIAVRVFRAMAAAGLPFVAQDGSRTNASAIIEQWSQPQFLKLRVGELNAGELRTVQAVLRGIAAAISAAGEDTQLE